MSLSFPVNMEGKLRWSQECFFWKKKKKSKIPRIVFVVNLHQHPTFVLKAVKKSSWGVLVFSCGQLMPVNSECVHTAPWMPCSPTEEPKPFQILLITKTVTVGPQPTPRALLPPDFLSSSVGDLTGHQLDGSTTKLSSSIFQHCLFFSHKGRAKVFESSQWKLGEPTTAFS